MSQTTSLLDEAKALGELVAWRHNQEMDSGVVGSREATDIRDARERLEVITDVLGDEAEEAFAEGYDTTVDFSLNTDWRN